MSDRPDRPDPAGDEEDAALTALRDASDRIVAGVERSLPGWVVTSVTTILDAWGRADATTRDRALDDARTAGAEAATRVSGELRTLFALDAVDQRATPLEIVRTAVHEPTVILERAGVPPVVRDEFDERAWPDDRYGLVPRDLGDLGDPDLAPLLLAWGIAKTKVLRVRARAQPGER